MLACVLPARKQYNVMRVIVRSVVLLIFIPCCVAILWIGKKESARPNSGDGRLPPNLPSSDEGGLSLDIDLDGDLGLDVVSVSNFSSTGPMPSSSSTFVTFAYTNETELIHKRFDRSVKDEEKDEMAYLKGDVIIGGLFPVHIPDDDVLCGKILTKSGMWTESMIYAISVINKDVSVLPNTTLGYEIRDDCSDYTQALQQTLNFIDVSSVEDSETCSGEPKTIGVVGTGKSSTSKAVSDLLTLFKIPQISYSASASEFSNKMRFPYFFRTVPSDKHQALVMSEIAKKYQWNLVSIIYSNDNYGIEGRQELEKNLQEANICVSESLILNGEKTAKEVVTKLNNSKAEIIFTFCGKDYISKILEESKKQNMTDKTWIACDSWAKNDQLIKGYERVVEGMLGVLPMSDVDDDFVKYLLSIDPLTHDNPFYKLTLAHHYNCAFTNSTTKRLCTRNDTFQIDVWSAFIMDAVYAFAYALDDMYRNKDGDYQSYAEYIRNVSFNGVTNPSFSFDRNGDPHARYKILNLQKVDNQWKFQRVFEWIPDKGFQEQQTEIQWKNNGQQPAGRCSKSCPAGMYQKVGKDLACCWTCEHCQDKTYTTKAGQSYCSSCEAGYSVNTENTKCTLNTVHYLKWSSMVTFFLILLAAVGLMMALACLTVFVRYRNTPTVKATSTELSYVLIIGVMFSFLCTFLFFGEPTDFICNARLVTMGVSFSIYVGALLMKTNRISRIFNRKLSDGRPSIFLSIKYQLMFIVVIVMVLVIVQGMIIYSSPSKRQENKEESDTYIQCKHNTLAPLAIIVYNLILALLCGYQAFRIRKLPGQFNDSRSISFTILTCCLIWFIFLASMFTKNGYSKAIICSIGFIANGMSALICMFFPKVWIIYMRPEENVRQSTINMKNASRITIVTRNGTTSISENSSANHKVAAFPEKKMEDSSTSTLNISEGLLENFMEKLCRKEEELVKMERGRDEVVEQANKLYKGLEEMQKRHDEQMAYLSEVYRTERQAFLDLMEGIGLNEADLVTLLERSAVTHAKSLVGDETDSCESSVMWKNIERYKLDTEEAVIDGKATDVLRPISRMMERSNKYRQTVQDLSKERQHLKHTIIQQLNGTMHDEEVEEEEEGELSEISTEEEGEGEVDKEEGEVDKEVASEMNPIRHSWLLYVEHESNV
ncbi:metabotropic glutamate receptor 2-like [Anneissia japonica]|uniref:metabotropic glutamate receptor 2-like n=1 Tax=Anneissia japonica TaxID=1529436 RepID=UPI00142595F0|nr:metabotropic glutamate receptor 2-like [Anneissia japonica]